jgi:hypothetical protein
MNRSFAAVVSIFMAFAMGTVCAQQNTVVDFVAARGNPALRGVGGDGRPVILAGFAGRAVSCTLSTPVHVFSLIGTADSLALPPSVKVKNDGRARKCLVYDADRELLSEGRVTFTSCLVMAVLSTLATHVAHLLPEQNGDTELAGHVLMTGSGIFSTGAIIGGILTRRGRARMALRRQRNATVQRHARRRAAEVLAAAPTAD